MDDFFKKALLDDLILAFFIEVLYLVKFTELKDRHKNSIWQNLPNRIL
jgi:hypothetical protein